MDSASQSRLVVDDEKLQGNFEFCASVESAAQSVLWQSAYDAVRDVRCSYRNGVVTLYGRVATFYLKQVAQTLVAKQIPQAATIDNRIEVIQHRG